MKQGPRKPLDNDGSTCGIEREFGGVRTCKTRRLVSSLRTPLGEHIRVQRSLVFFLFFSNSSSVCADQQTMLQHLDEQRCIELHLYCTHFGRHAPNLYIVMFSTCSK